MARQQLSAELSIGASLGRGVRKTFDFLDSRVDKAMRRVMGFNQQVAGMGKSGRAVAGLARGVASLTGAFRGTTAEIGRTHDELRGLSRRARSLEKAAADALKAGESTKKWERQLAKVNIQLEKQEKRLTQLRRARERFDRAGRRFGEVRERVGGGVRAIGRRAGYAGIGAAVAGGYAATQSFQKFTEFDNILSTLRAEGVASAEIPAISDEILRFASETRFTALEIGQLLVSMKKDGQEITSELAGFGDLLKFAVAENKDINTTWDVTRTYINSTNTALADAVTLQEELSNATSLSKLQIEDYGEIAAKALSLFSGLQNWDTRGFNAAAGFLADMGIQTETVGVTLRQLPILLANAAEGSLGKEKQGVFDALGISIADSKGELRDFITVLSQFRTAFRREGLLTEAGRITTPGVAVLSEIFDKRYANAVGQMIAGVDKIEQNMEGVSRVGTLDEKFAVHSETLFAAVKRFESARESLGLRLMMTMNQDDNFIRMFDGLTAKTVEFIDFVKANSGQIASIGTAIIDGLAWAGEKMLTVGGMVFDYFSERGPALKVFFNDLWSDMKDVWSTLEPIVMGVVRGLRSMFDAAGRLTGGNTKLVAWLASAYIGFRLLRTPVLALMGGFDLVVGSISKVQAAWTTLGDIRTPTPLEERWGTPGAQGTNKRGGIFGKFKMPPVLVRLGPIFAGIGAKLSFLAPVVGALGSAFTAVGAAVGTVVAGIAGLGALPIVAIVAGVVAVIAGGVALVVANWDKVKLAVSETWDSIKLFGSAVWETLKWLGGAVTDLFGNMFKNVDVFLQKFGINITGIFTQLGDWFKGLFSGIWNAIKGIGGFLSAQFGRMLGWIASLNDTFQGFVTGWRDFFKERNDQREGVAGVKVELPTLDDRTKSQIRQGQQPDFAMDAPPAIETGIPARSLDRPLTMNVEQPDIPALNIERPDIPSLAVDTPTFGPAPMDLDAQQRRHTPRASSVEYVDFAGVDEIDKTLKSGFDSLIGITDQILVQLKTVSPRGESRKGIITEGYETSALAIDVAENTVASTIPSVTIETSTTQIPDGYPRAVKPSIESAVPALDAPDLIVPDKTLNVAPITNPVLQVPDMDIPAIDNPVMHIPSVEIPELALDAPLIDLPALAVDTPVPAVNVTENTIPELALDAPVIDLPALAVDTPVPAVNVTENTIPELALDAPVIDLPALAVDTPVPAVNVTENTIPELALDAPVIDLPALAVDTPVPAVNVTENTIPELALDAPVIDLPALAVDTPIVNLSGIQTETQPPIFNPPPIQTELPGIDIPQIQTPEALVNVPVIEIPEPQSVEFEVPSLSAPDTVDAGQGDKIEENITFNVYQQPGEDVVELTDRIMGELEKRSRAGYYE